MDCVQNGGGRMGLGGICVFYLKCRSQGKLSSWNSCGQTQTSGPSHGHKSRFSWMRLDGWRHLDIQNYRKMTCEVYKSVQASVVTWHNSHFQPVPVNVLAFWWVSLSIQVPANSFGTLSQGCDYRAADFQYVSLCLGNEFVVFGKKVLVLHLAPSKGPNYRLKFFSCLNIFAVCTQVS